VGPLPPDQTTLTWRQRQLPLHTPEGTEKATLVAIVEHDGQAAAARINRLIGLVPVGMGEISALPGIAGSTRSAGAQMLNMPTHGASYVILRSSELTATGTS